MTNEDQTETEDVTPNPATVSPPIDVIDVAGDDNSNVLAAGIGVGLDPSKSDDEQDFAPPAFVIGKPGTGIPQISEETMARVRAAREAAAKDPEANRVADMPTEADLAAMGVPGFAVVPNVEIGRSTEFSVRYGLGGFSSSASVSEETDSVTGKVSGRGYANVSSDVTRTNADGSKEIVRADTGQDAARALVANLRAMADLIERDAGI